MTEADLLPLAELLPDDVELDPAATRYSGLSEAANRYSGLSEAANRRVIGFQHYWNSYGSWRPERWRLAFCVRSGGELVGVQELEAEDFPGLRTVDSASQVTGPADASRSCAAARPWHTSTAVRLAASMGVIIAYASRAVVTERGCAADVCELE